MLEKNKNIQYISLKGILKIKIKGNNFGIQGCESLSLMMEKNNTITSINLYGIPNNIKLGNNIGDEGCRCLKFLETNKKN